MDRGKGTMPGDSRPRVLLVSPSKVASFIEQDYRFLSSEFETTLYVYNGRFSLPALRKAIHSVDAVVNWFAAPPHAAPSVWWARRIGIPVITIVGGYEVVWLQDIPYGVKPRSRWGWIVRWILRKSDLLLPVSAVTEKGVRRLICRRSSDIRIIHNAIDISRFTIDSKLERKTILTVAQFHRVTLQVKGLRLFWEVAEQLPGLRFVAVGPALDDEAKAFVARRPPNLVWTGPLHGLDLVHQFQSALVYFQASRHESFSVAVAESMACGCIPVLSRNGALPEVAGDIGYYMDELTPESGVSAVRKALGAPSERRLAARQRIVDLFGADRRKRALCDALHELLRFQGKVRN